MHQEQTTDWTIFDHPRVDPICTWVAYRIAINPELGTHVERRDAEQEARLLAAHMGERVWACIREEGALTLGTFQHELYRDMYDKARVIRDQASRTQSADRRYDESREDFRPPFASAPQRTGVGEYDRDLVVQLLPGVWDYCFAWSSIIENVPDADMPRDSVNKATGGTLAAHLADVRAAWRRAPLNDEERRALFLAAATLPVQIIDLRQRARWRSATQVTGGWSQEKVAEHQQVSQSTISRRIDRGVSKMLAWLTHDKPSRLHVTCPGSDRAGLAAPVAA